MGWLGVKKGVTFDVNHSYRDYGMFMASRPEISPPMPKLVTVDIPGADGALDLTEAAVGETKYENRRIELRFTAIVDIEEQQEFKRRLYNDIHGRKLKIVLDEDSDYYYYGRCTVSAENETPKKIGISVTVDADPYKHEIEQTEMTLPLNSFGSVRVSYDYTRVVSANGSIIETAFPVGSAKYRAGDFSAFSRLIINWSEQNPVPAITIVVQDVNRNQYRWQLEPSEYGPQTGGAAISISSLTNAGVDVHNILFVRILGRADCSLSGRADSGASATIINGRMEVVPTFDAPSGGINMILNGRLLELPGGVSRNPEAYFCSGENELVFIAGENQPENSIVSVYFRRGWL